LEQIKAQQFVSKQIESYFCWTSKYLSDTLTYTDVKSGGEPFAMLCKICQPRIWTLDLLHTRHVYLRKLFGRRDGSSLYHLLPQKIIW